MASNTHTQRLLPQPFKLLRSNEQDVGCLVSAGFNHFPFFKDNTEHWLHVDEQRYYKTLTAERRQASYLLGRITAKKALLETGSDSPYSGINICMGAFKDPVPHFPSDRPLQVGITHTSTMAASLAFPATHPMAIDLEDLDVKRAQTMQKHCQPAEWEEMDGEGMDPTLLFTILWTAKEAIAKALRIGLTSPFSLMAVKGLKQHPKSGWVGFYQHFTQYQFRSWRVADRVVSIVFPKQTQLVFDKESPVLQSP